MLPAGFEPAIPASERPHTHVLRRAAAGIGPLITYTKLAGIFLPGNSVKTEVYSVR